MNAMTEQSSQSPYQEIRQLNFVLRRSMAAVDSDEQSTAARRAADKLHSQHPFAGSHMLHELL